MKSSLQGQGLGSRESEALQQMGYAGEAIEATGDALPQRKLRKWERMRSSAKANTPIYWMQTKDDRYGLGYDPYKNAEAFRSARASQRKAAASAPAGVSHSISQNCFDRAKA